MDLWKVRRELGRLKQQLLAFPEAVYEPFARWHHDRTRADRLRVVPGAVPGCNKVAIFLLYQPGGVAPSSSATCEHLTRFGYAPLVISNAQLSQQDRQRLQRVAWQVVERPNFGYDFGGYRDALWLLQRWGNKPHRLVLMNDSIWFPAVADDRSLIAMENMPSDVTGMFQIDSSEPTSFRRERAPFLASFFLMFNERALGSEAFQQFWRRYRNTSNKYKTIRRGERSLSYALGDSGLRLGSLFCRGDFEQWLVSLPPEQIQRLLSEVVTLEEQAQAQLRAAAATSCGDGEIAVAQHHQHMLQAIRFATRKSNLYSTMPISLMRDFRLAFLKKTLDPWNAKALKRLLDHQRSTAASLPMTEEVCAELVRRIQGPA